MKSPFSADVPAYDREMASPLLAHTAKPISRRREFPPSPGRLDFRVTKTHRR